MVRGEGAIHSQFCNAAISVTKLQMAMASIATPSLHSGPCKAIKNAFGAGPLQGRRRVSQVCTAGERAGDVSRRQLLQLVSLPTVGLALADAAQAAGKAPKGFNPVVDQNDGYQFLYPFGWQEVSVRGTDVAYKDVVEPLESCSVTLTRTEKNDITEFGSPQEVAETLANEVLTAPGQEVKLLGATQRELKGHNYYEFEFIATAPRFQRHQVAVVAAANGNFYTLITGSSERRWGKMKDKLNTTVRSFSLTI